ncbi:MAG: hypothetical protein NZU63_11285, partial [Gemmataceae bacterium]|nr:hypothetical protein [Gemmataceae bacterium]
AVGGGQWWVGEMGEWDAVGGGGWAGGGGAGGEGGGCRSGRRRRKRRRRADGTGPVKLGVLDIRAG